MIKFLCPNGHPLAAPESRVGKAGQCPRCQSRFVVPAPRQPQDATSSAPTDRRASDTQPRGAQAADDTFMFLCPNGHKLYGAPSMQGRPGQCPHCHSRFLIPAAAAAESGEEESGEEEAGEEERFPGLDDATLHEVVWDGPPGATDPAADDAAPLWSERPAGEPPPPPSPVSCHPLGHIIRRIWTDQCSTEPLELRLADGTVMLVESCSVELSQHEYGVFAVRNDDFSASVVVIPWDQITRATLPRVAALPADLSRAAAPTTPRPDRLR
jgi:hypothetical protein